MEITAVMLARIVAFVEVQELNPKGKAYYPDIVAALVERFNFRVYPTKPEEFDESKGVQFADGKFGEGTIDRLQIFTHGIIVDTRVSTDVSEKLLRDTLVWANSKLGLHFEDRMIKRRGFGSQLTFESEMDLSQLNPVMRRISKSISSKLSGTMGQPATYEPTGILFNLDQSISKLTPGTFTIERRAEVPFSEKKYFSNAPLATQDHIDLLVDFETTLVTPKR
jgi:hypothetical protein